MQKLWLGRSLNVIALAAALYTAHAPRVARADDAVALKRTYTAGSEYTIEQMVKLHQTLTVQGNPVETGNTSTTRVKTACESIDGEGRATVFDEITAVRSDIQLPGGLRLQFDSTLPDQPNENALLEPVRQAIRSSVGMKFTRLIDAAGHVVSVSGGSEALQKAGPQAEAILKDRLSEASLRREYDEDAGRYPAEPVKPGDSWPQTTVLNLEGGQTLTFEVRYTYVGPEEKDGKKLQKVKSEHTSVRYAVAAGSPLELVSSDFKVSESGSELWYDPEAGRYITSNSRVHIVGPAVIKVNTTQLELGLDLVLEVESHEVK